MNVIDERNILFISHQPNGGVLSIAKLSQYLVFAVVKLAYANGMKSSRSIFFHALLHRFLPLICEDSHNDNASQNARLEKITYQKEG